MQQRGRTGVGEHGAPQVALGEIMQLTVEEREQLVCRARIRVSARRMGIKEAWSIQPLPAEGRSGRRKLPQPPPRPKTWSSAHPAPRRPGFHRPGKATKRTAHHGHRRALASIGVHGHECAAAGIALRL